MENISDGSAVIAGDSPRLTRQQALAALRSEIAKEKIWLMDERHLRLMLADPASTVFCEAVEAARPSADSGNGSIAVIPITGPIFYRFSYWSDSLMTLRNRFRKAASDPSIKAIVLDIHSPGGTVPGVTEFASDIFEARDEKPIVAVANAMAASAAYWIASAATELVVTPSGEVGSIGVWAGHVDLSKMLENEGVKITLVSAGKFKVEGNPWEPLTEEARAALQASVDETYQQFVADVAKGRGKSTAQVIGDFGEGRMVSAARAREVGMVDRIATLDQVLAKLSVSKETGRIRFASDQEPELQLAEL